MKNWQIKGILLHMLCLIPKVLDLLSQTIIVGGFDIKTYRNVDARDVHK